MQIAVLSGKGGTGKTFVSVNLAVTAKNSTYLDCDVEEPNGHLFLKPEIHETEAVEIAVPEFDPDACDGCRACIRFCRFNALAFIKEKPYLFAELCHSCSGCMLICHNHAIHEVNRRIGMIEKGKSGGISVITGTLDSGEATSVPVIRQLLRDAPTEGTVIIDCPPGSSCTVMESIRNSDFCLLVAEPTLFGIENLKLVVQLVKTFHKKCGIVVNKDTEIVDPIKVLANESNIPVLARIPYDQGLAEINARGGLAVEDKKYEKIFRGLLVKIEKSGGKS
ncbi:MAG: ATP-binding protein [Oscillospiraceae bacterium]|nr:ATP-binding protein [Oscillospiraceae bacterium]